MIIRFSPSTGSFYPSDIEYPNALPDDVIEVSVEDFQRAIDARAAGNIISFVNGVLVISPPPPIVRSPELIRQQNILQRDYLLGIATSAIAPLQDAVDLGEATPEETAALTAWKKFRIAVNRVNLTIDGVVWPDFPPQHYAALIESDV